MKHPGTFLSEPRKQTAETRNSPLELQVHIVGYRNCAILDTAHGHIWRSVYDIPPSIVAKFADVPAVSKIDRSNKGRALLRPWLDGVLERCGVAE